MLFMEVFCLGTVGIFTKEVEKVPSIELEFPLSRNDISYNRYKQNQNRSSVCLLSHG